MVNINRHKLTNLQRDILDFLFVRAGQSFNQRSLSKFLKVSAPAVMKALPLLEKKEFITINQDKESKRWSIELNRDNHKILQLKRANNLEQLYLLNVVDFLEKEFAGGTIILFGSYSRGDDIFNSDIDIAIIGRKKKKIDLSNFEKILSKEINLNFYDSFKEMNKNLKENILNGIVLVGGIEL